MSECQLGMKHSAISHIGSWILLHLIIIMSDTNSVWSKRESAINQ